MFVWIPENTLEKYFSFWSCM